MLFRIKGFVRLYAMMRRSSMSESMPSPHYHASYVDRILPVIHHVESKSMRCYGHNFSDKADPIWIPTPRHMENWAQKWLFTVSAYKLIWTPWSPLIIWYKLVVLVYITTTWEIKTGVVPYGTPCEDWWCAAFYKKGLEVHRPQAN